MGLDELGERAAPVPRPVGRDYGCIERRATASPTVRRSTSRAALDGLRRRIFLVGTGAVLARTGAAAAEQRVSLHSIGYIALNSARIGHDVLVAFRSALSESGWIDG